MRVTIKAKFSNQDIDKIISIALMASFVILTLQFFVLMTFNLSDTTLGSQIQMLSKVLVGLVYLIALPKVMQRGLKSIIYVYLISGIIFLIQYLFYPGNRNIMQSLFFPVFFMSMPSLIYAFNIKDLTTFKAIMVKASFIVYLIGGLLAILVFSGNVDIGPYSMTLSYYLLLPTIMFLDKFIDKFSFKTLFIVLTSMLIIIALGARGPFIGIFAFIPLKLIKPNTKLTIKRLIGFMFSSVIIIMGFIFRNRLLLRLNEVLANFGIRSRTISLFLSDGLNTSGRDGIYSLAINAILKSPVFGYGIGADSFITGHDYVHNFFLEVLLHFGIIIGVIISIVLLAKLLYKLIKYNRINYNLIIIWVSIGFVHLMVSATYTTNINFWIFLGVLFTTRSAKLKKV